MNQRKKPTIFLIVVEALNQNIIHQKTESGEEITPFLNQLSQDSLVVKHFYANSIQSARGYISIFLSLVPSITDKITSQYDDLTTYSLADVLSENRFDNSARFLAQRGFDMKTVKPYIKSEDKPYVWRAWGPEDNVFFKRFFDYYDQGQFKDKDMFFSLITVASHFPFSSVPVHRCFIKIRPPFMRNMPIACIWWIKAFAYFLKN